MFKVTFCRRPGCASKAVGDSGRCNYHFNQSRPHECKIYGCSAIGHAKECPEFAASYLESAADSVPSGSKALTPPGKQKPVLIEPAEQKEKL